MRCHSLILLTLTACASVPQAPVRGNATVAVLAVMQQQVDAWNRGDLEGFCAGYVPDAVFVTPSDVTRGRAQVLERYRTKYVQRDGMGHLQLTAIDVREGADTVSVAAHWALTWPQKAPAEGSTVVVFVKTPQGWQIVHDASM